MSTIRLFLAWLLMAALPLQGMAAASMLFCGSQVAARVAQAVPHQGHHASMDMSAHDHAAHGHDGALASHGAQAGEADGERPPSHGAQAAGEASPSHSCPVCASCSQAQAVGAFDTLQLASTAPSAQPAPPHVRVSSRALTLPDKPPRA